MRDLLAPIITDIRRFGLKALHLRKYQKDVEHFYREIISGHPVQDEITAKYQKRFERYRNSVFCFLSADGIPWNNNAAESCVDVDKYNKGCSRRTTEQLDWTTDAE